MSITLLDKLYENGDLRDLIHCGMVQPAVITWRKVYHAYNLQRENGVKSAQAITNVSEAFGVSESFVYKAIQKLKPDVKGK